MVYTSCLNKIKEAMGLKDVDYKSTWLLFINKALKLIVYTYASGALFYMKRRINHGDKLLVTITDLGRYVSNNLGNSINIEAMEFIEFYKHLSNSDKKAYLMMCSVVTKQLIKAITGDIKFDDEMIIYISYLLQTVIQKNIVNCLQSNNEYKCLMDNFNKTLPGNVIYPNEVKKMLDDIYYHHQDNPYITGELTGLFNSLNIPSTDLDELINSLKL